MIFLGQAAKDLLNPDVVVRQSHLKKTNFIDFRIFKRKNVIFVLLHLAFCFVYLQYAGTFS